MTTTINYAAGTQDGELIPQLGMIVENRTSGRRYVIADITDGWVELGQDKGRSYSKLVTRLWKTYAWTGSITPDQP